MNFTTLIGQDINIRLLKNALRRGRVSHAYLFAGPRGSGKKTLAMAFARALNCEDPGLAERDFEPCGECNSCRKVASGQHPDVTLVEPDGARLKIEQMRGMQKANALRAYEGRCKVFVVDRAETMTDQAANSLLKALEEPLGPTVFMLLAESEAQVLPTLVSRCVTVSLRLLPEAEMVRRLAESNGWPEPKARFLTKLAQGALGRALELEPSYDELTALVSESLAATEQANRAKLLEMAPAFEKQRELAEVFLDALAVVLRDRAVLGQSELAGVETALRAVTATRKSFQSNVNPRLAMEVLFLQLVRCFCGGPVFPVFQESSSSGGF